MCKQVKRNDGDVELKCFFHCQTSKITKCSSLLLPGTPPPPKKKKKVAVDSAAVRFPQELHCLCCHFRNFVCFLSGERQGSC